MKPGDSAGLLRHIDGVQVDGSLILALPSDPSGGSEWRGKGGGVTVWEGPEEDEVQWDYAMDPGDICFLDNYVWHQGNPITAGERWVLVIFYRTKAVKGTRFSRMFLKAAAERKRKAEAEAAKGNAAGADAMTPEQLMDEVRAGRMTMAQMKAAKAAKGAGRQVTAAER